MLKKAYSKDDLTVIWQPDLCIHSGICFRSLPTVFQPRERPWIKIEAADKEAIVNTVQKCPSGALSFKSAHEEVTPPAISSQPEWHKVAVVTNGPLRIKDACLVTLANGEVVEKPNGVSLCRCGDSSNKPFCDGSHKHNGFAG